MFFLLIIPGLLVADLLWWRWSDRKVSALRPSRVRSAVRLLIAIFMIAQIAGFAFIIGSRFVGIRASLPAWLLAQVYVWHLFVLPFTVVAWLIYLLLSFTVVGLRNRSSTRLGTGKRRS
ncbi:MAG: hypothetical protein H7Z14_21065, partial [Anaerolineae bacterium]|nr:hypothetical protein [Phycisphaerae bacterium]